MLILFWVIVGLTGILLFKNARYAVQQYVTDCNRLVITLYFIFLFILGYMVVRITSRIMSLVQAAAEDTSVAPPLRPRVEPLE